MSPTEELKRIVPGAEIFFGESVAQYLAEISEESFQSEVYAEGLLLGRRYHDDAGYYVVVSGLTLDFSRLSDAVGWFRTAEGMDFTPSFVRTVSELFRYQKAYAILVDPAAESMGMYSVEHGVARKAPSMMIENM